jgi:hypothetical protein
MNVVFPLLWKSLSSQINQKHHQPPNAVTIAAPPLEAEKLYRLYTGYRTQGRVYRVTVTSLLRALLPHLPEVIHTIFHLPITMAHTAPFAPLRPFCLEQYRLWDREVEREDLFRAYKECNAGLVLIFDPAIPGRARRSLPTACAMEYKEQIITMLPETIRSDGAVA